MKRQVIIGILLILFITGCRVNKLFSSPTITVPALPTIIPATPTPEPTNTITPTVTPTVTETPTPTQTPTPVVYGPTNFPSNVDPLTGMAVTDPDILNRRPIAIKINIVPRRSNRPPWGLSYADIVYDYYHNAGYSRFHAIFYGSDASLAGPIRSGRLLDYDLVHMYKSIFAYGSADILINQRLLNSDFADRIILEGNSVLCPPTPSIPLCRIEPNTNDLLLGDTAALSAYITAQGVENGRQNLDGMTFHASIPSGAEAGIQLYVRYSGDNYTRWDYDALTGRYLRFQDNVFDTGQGEEYAPLTDQLNNEQIGAENVVVIIAEHQFFQNPPHEIIDIALSGTGTAYAFRDGLMYRVQWNRPTTDSVLFLTNSDGTAFPFKPGKTYFQVVGLSSSADQTSAGVWRFDFNMP